MLMNQLRSKLVSRVFMRQQLPLTAALMGVRTPVRFFAIAKYTFDDESFDPDRYQISMKSHKTNAEELINALPIVEVQGDTARCTGVNELGLGHPVQYIQLNRRHEHTPATCKWCGLRFKKIAGHHHH